MWVNIPPTGGCADVVSLHRKLSMFVGGGRRAVGLVCQGALLAVLPYSASPLTRELGEFSSWYSQYVKTVTPSFPERARKREQRKEQRAGSHTHTHSMLFSPL